MIKKILEISKIENPETQKIITTLFEEKSTDLEKLFNLLTEIDRVKLDEQSFTSAILDFVFASGKEEEYAFVKENFSDEIYTIFTSLKALEKYQTEHLNQAENFRMMLVAISKDIRVLVIKLCVILHTVRGYVNPVSEKQKNYLLQVKEIFAPLAERLGLNFIKGELEDICLRFLEPDVYDFLQSSVELQKEENEKQIAITKQKVEAILKEQGLEGSIMFRRKHFSSIHKKMQSKNLSLAKIHDLIAMRVLVNSIEDCYAVVGGIHGIYKPMPGRFKDYIATPKPNGYQSLHTTIIAENERPLEIQIRTKEMHQISEYGIAAHWIYKEKRVKKSVLDEKLGWIRAIMESTESLTSRELIDTFKKQLNAGVIYVQTPKGKIMEFPEEATLIDFAYAIHSDVGNACVGGKINGKIKPLASVLSNGDVVEIITSPNSKGPSRDWLNIAVTATAKNKIKYFFRKEFKEEHIKTGKKMVEEEIKGRSLDVSKLIQGPVMDVVMDKLCFKEVEELFASVGYGSVSVKQVVNRLISENNKQNPTIIEKPIFSQNLIVRKTKDGVLVDGDSGMLIRYAGCCSPVFGDEIVGYVSRGKGVTIHRKDCHHVNFLEQERLLPADWQEKVQGQLFTTSLKVVSLPSKTLGQTIMKQIMESKVYILGFNTKTDAKNNMIMTIKLQVGSQEQLLQLIKQIENHKEVYEVSRTNE